MTENEFLQAMSDMMDKKLEPVYKRMDSMESRMDSIQTDLTALREDVEEVKLDGKITRTAVNKLLDWADDAAIQVIPLFSKRKTTEEEYKKETEPSAAAN